MATSARVTFFSAIGFVVCGTTACNMVPQSALRSSQLRTMQLHRQNVAIASERDQARQLAQSLASEKQHLKQGLAAASERLDNLQAERSKLHQRYVGLLNEAGKQPSPLSDRATERLKQLQQQYPEFEFDPLTGVSKFHSDILFDTGNAQLKASAEQLLRDFASIMNEKGAQTLNILVVGHTDDQRIAKPGTKSKHPTNWHLSTNRANSVVLALRKYGIKPERMGAAGYSMYQPVAANKDGKTRQKNRRVEIFVLAPDAAVASWDPTTSRN